MNTEDKLKRSIRNLALRYLSRYATSSAKLHKYLITKLKKYQKDDFNEEVMSPIISSVVESLVNAGYLNDTLYAKSQINSLLNSGKSLTHINFKLQEKGISKTDIQDILTHQNDEELNLYALIKFIKTKKILCFRTKPVLEEDKYKIKEKDMATLFRNGFSMSVIKEITNKLPEELEDTYYELKNKISLL